VVGTEPLQVEGAIGFLPLREGRLRFFL